MFRLLFFYICCVAISNIAFLYFIISTICIDCKIASKIALNRKLESKRRMF